MLNIARLDQHSMELHPFRWKFIDGLFEPADAAALAASYPFDHFRKVSGYDGEKGYVYSSRSLIHMGSDGISNPRGLSPAWRELAEDLLSACYRAAMSRLTGLDLSACVLEVNVIHYGPGAWLGPHLDLKEKMMTHVLYFNESWDPRDGGCLQILNSSRADDVVAEIPPIVGGSSLLVRSDNSWHTVSKVSNACRQSRRSVNVIFHQPGSVSTMWPPGETVSVGDYVESEVCSLWDLPEAQAEP